MPPLGPVKRRDLIRFLRQLGFDGPYSGGRHQFMAKGELTLFIPNPHQGDIGVGLLARVLRQAGIDRAVWEKL
ncbi:MAG TPA: type II toxin-antitoxin system HicA family toxin [Planctomycetota bacterium]|nr:type II toxin-antitoxin system HicA family toxin [Planctomycetota bacterium]HRR81594.1 type II toxin-antitoxin system HicA family toxin [Planctomycetota bacterium]HRT94853.1 type II toxin-antitoxin system HicA family toxin [Planctomycetota bacterium]